MSSGYSSLEEDSEEYFFTARTSFFKKPQGKLTDRKVKILFLLSSYVGTCPVLTGDICTFSVANVNPRCQR